MPATLLGAALLATAIAFVHSILGEHYILTRLFWRADLPHLFGSDWFTRRTLRFAWHLTSLAWLGLGAVLVLAPPGPHGTGVRRVVAACFLASAVLTAGASRGRHLAWVVFLVIGVLGWAAG
ncbi:MAG TPA: hypothetical protein VMK53_10450 [Gemmatimonadales bacterium]|nr:hypothetical protein [Gemmatimonadales bacterium]